MPANPGDAGLTLGLGRSPGIRNDNPLQYSCWRIPWTEEAGGLQSMGSQRVSTTEQLSMHIRCYLYKYICIFIL